MKYKTKKEFRKSYTFGIAKTMYKIRNNELYLTDNALKNKTCPFTSNSKKALNNINCKKQIIKQN